MLDDRRLNFFHPSRSRRMYRRTGVNLNLKKKGLADTAFCLAALHSQYRSVLGQANWLQSRTQYQACYQFSRCASASAGPTGADVRALNKLVRSIRAEQCVLRCWPLKSSLRLVGYPDAAYRNNVANSSQRGQTNISGRRKNFIKGGFWLYGLVLNVTC